MFFSVWGTALRPLLPESPNASMAYHNNKWQTKFHFARTDGPVNSIHLSYDTGLFGADLNPIPANLTSII